MPVKFLERIPTVDYGYVEIETDDFPAFVEARTATHDELLATAVQAVQDAGLTRSNPGLSGPAPDQQQQAWSPANSSTTPTCQHGPQKWVPPGVSKSPPYKPYQGFWACQGPRDQRCQRS